MEHNIFINEVVHIEKEEQLYRVLWVSPEQEYGYWISLEKQSRVPDRFICPKMLEGISTGAITVVEDPVVISEGNVSETAKEKRDEWWHILKPVLECEPDIYERRRRGELLSEVAKRNNRDKANLYRYLVKYWKKGKTPNAFLPDYRNCGKGDKTQKDKKLGRPVKHDGNFGKVITKEDVGYFESAIRKYYLKRKDVTIKSTYEKMLGDFYSVKAQDQNGNEYLQLLPEDQIPSITQFRYWYKKNQNIKTEIQKRKGDWIHARLIHEFDKPRWNEWGEAALAELKAAYAEIQSSGDKRKRVTISWLARATGINRDDIYGRLRYLPEMQKFFDEVCETQEEWIRRRYTEIALEKKKAGGKEFTYDDVKRKVQVRRGSYERNKELIENLIVELNGIFQ